ncbi:nucleoid-associated protein [Phocoenobacter skyensis]|uniref:Nucleoid-associated protein n=1 Tax=Phocoenobacter skyensis TaxID=97481 RepID=A0ABT9JPN9_9PAST|nr:nucleoid-associated protein [Pasteurella skyensis]MDP8080227.1 nucleoid-associated protein [Pasteurella skyensis]MDP8086234.1 nucleoid-associated protein [Pasteurella skyensis]
MIKHIIYHILNKEVQGNADIEHSPTEIKPSAVHLNFLNKLTEAYSSRAGKGFGQFDADEDSYPMPRIMRDYLNNQNFYATTERMMKILSNRIQDQSLAKGGKVFIVHFEENHNEYLLIAILSDKLAFSTTDWQLKEAEVLALENLKYAGRINLTAWQAGEQRYISFLKGQGDIAQYFKLFLGCNDVLIAQKETKKLVEHLEEFANEQGLEVEQKTEFFERAQEYLYEISDNEEPFSAETFANRVWSENPQELKNKISDAETGVSDGFIPDKRSIKKLSTFTGKTKHWRLTFDRNAVSCGDIELNNGRIIINNPPEKLLGAFE